MLKQNNGNMDVKECKSNREARKRNKCNKLITSRSLLVFCFKNGYHCCHCLYDCQPVKTFLS